MSEQQAEYNSGKSTEINFPKVELVPFDRVGACPSYKAMVLGQEFAEVLYEEYEHPAPDLDDLIEEELTGIKSGKSYFLVRFPNWTNIREIRISCSRIVDDKLMYVEAIVNDRWSWFYAGMLSFFMNSTKHLEGATTVLQMMLDNLNGLSDRETVLLRNRLASALAAAKLVGAQPATNVPPVLQTKKDQAQRLPALVLDIHHIRHSRSGSPTITGPEDIEVSATVVSRIWDYEKAGYLLFAIANDDSIAKGLKTSEGIRAELLATQEIFPYTFQEMRICTATPEGLPESQLDYYSLQRKPELGMLTLCEKQAMEAGIIVDWPNSIFVGEVIEELMAERVGAQFLTCEEFFGVTK